MASGAVAIFFGNRFGSNRLRRHDGGIVEHGLARADDQIRPAFLHAGEILAPVDLVDEKFEIEVFSGLRVVELGSVAKRAVTGLDSSAAMGFEWVVAVVACRGFNQRRSR